MGRSSGILEDSDSEATSVEPRSQRESVVSLPSTPTVLAPTAHGAAAATSPASLVPPVRLDRREVYMVEDGGTSAGGR